MSQNIFFQSDQLQFQNFQYSQVQDNSYASSTSYGQPGYTPPPAPVSYKSVRSAFGTGDDPSEPPLLHGKFLLIQELGINFEHIKTKALTVMNPFRQIDKHIMDDSDLAGPFLFCLLFGAFLMLSGKLQFGFIYGVAVLGCLSMYIILNLMSETGIDIYRCSSVLGYCLLPMVILSSLASFFSFSGTLAFGLSVFSVIWCTFAASTMFVTVLSMNEQRILVAYPVALLYSAFAILAIF